MLLIFFFTISYFLLARFCLDWALLVLIFALPSYLIRFKILGLPSTLLELMILICFFVWFVWHTEFKNFIRGTYTFKDFWQNYKKRIKYPFAIEIILILIISYVAIAVSGFSARALGIWRAYFFEPILLFIVVVNVFGPHAKQKREFQCNYEKCPLSKIKQLIWFQKLAKLVFKSQNIKISDSLEKIILALSFSAFSISLFGIWQNFSGVLWSEKWQAADRITSIFLYPNALGLYLGPIVVLLIGYLFGLIKYKRLLKKGNNQDKQILNNQLKQKIIFIFISIILSLIAIFLARSEGALIGIMVAFLFIMFFWGFRSRVIAFVFIFLVIGLILSSADMQQKVQQKIFLRDLSGEIRKQQWRETWEMLVSNPSRFVLGSGLAGYQKAVKPFHQEGIFFNKDNDPDFRRKIVIFDKKYKAEHWQPVEIYLYPHNIILNFWTEIGLLGAFLFLWLMIKYIDEALFLRQYSTKYEQGVLLGLAGAMVVVIVHGLVDVPYFKNDLAALFWILFACLSILKLKKEIKYSN